MAREPNLASQKQVLVSFMFCWPCTFKLIHFFQNNKYQVWHKHSFFSWWWAHSRPKYVGVNKYTKNKLFTKLALFTRLLVSSLKYSFIFKI
jgi:hypothetical protein